jgi:uncharacterized protein (DUF1778 family)
MSSSSKRDRRIFVRTSSGENEALKQRAAAHHMSLSSFLREAGLTQTRSIQVRKWQQDIRQMTALLHRVYQLQQLDPSEPKIQELIAQVALLLAEIDTELNM